MSTLDITMAAVHLLFAGLWTGSVSFHTVALLPAAKGGNLNAAPFGETTVRLRWLSRAAVVVLFVTGGHIAAQRYTFERLTGTTAGYAVLAMVALWLAMAALVEVGSGRILDGTDAGKVREPARAASSLFAVAAVVGCVLLLLGGVLTAV